MGIRGELFSTKMTCEGRTYFFNVKQNRMGDVFLSIVESKPTETEAFDRRSIVIFREDMHSFLKAFQSTLGFMEKPGTKPPEVSFSPDEGGAAYARPRGTADEGEGPASPERKRRVVVKKRNAGSSEKEGKDEAGAG